MDLTKLSIAKLEIFNVHYQPIKKLVDLRIYLQNAVTLEFATIPPYTTAMYSIRNKSCDAYRLTSSVAMEEMFHVYQAANLLISVGGIPRFTDGFTPKYPTFIPHGDKKTTPYISLRGATHEVYRNVFMTIETPATYESPPEDENIQTIGQFYKAIEDGLRYLEAEAQQSGDTIFKNTLGYVQHQDYYFGQGGGHIIQVHDLNSACKGILQIVQQGEGAVQPNDPLVTKEPWGAYNHYGKRTDGHFGPITGSNQELSHYFRFKTIADGIAPIPAIFPVVSVPDIGEYKNKKANKLAHAFNIVYSIFLRALEGSFKEGAEARRKYFETAVPVMHQQLPSLAQMIMQTPIWSYGDPTVGPNAMPTWEYTDATVHEAIDIMIETYDLIQSDYQHSPSNEANQFMIALTCSIDELKTFSNNFDQQGYGESCYD